MSKGPGMQREKSLPRTALVVFTISSALSRVRTDPVPQVDLKERHLYHLLPRLQEERMVSHWSQLLCIRAHPVCSE